MLSLFSIKIRKLLLGICETKLLLFAITRNFRSQDHIPSIANRLRLTILLINSTILATCVPTLTQKQVYDSRRITIQTLNLYNQRSYNTNQPNIKWRGDWAFRRERLDIIDQNLKDVKPDLIIFQETMKRKSSMTESDQQILLAGALKGYEWSSDPIQYFSDTDEIEESAIAVGIPLKIVNNETIPPSLFFIFSDGYFSLYPLILENETIAIVNIKEPSNFENTWYSTLTTQIQSYLNATNSCAKRLIIAGTFGSEKYMDSIKKLQERFRLKDASYGLCDQESSCYTTTPWNEIFYKAKGDQTPRNMDRILFHKDTIVHTSQRNFDKPIKFPYRLKRTYDLNQLWPSHHFGWMSTIRLSRCNLK